MSESFNKLKRRSEAENTPAQTPSPLAGDSDWGSQTGGAPAGGHDFGQIAIFPPATGETGPVVQRQAQTGGVAAPDQGGAQEDAAGQGEQGDAAITRRDIADLIERHEGRRSRVYTDTEGHPTIGIGFNLDRGNARARLRELGLDYQAVRSGRVELTDAQIDQLFAADLNQSIEDARDLVDNYDQLSANRQAVLADMAFNLGRNGLAQFRRMIAAVEAENWERAAAEMRDSRWYNQVGNRGPENVQLMREGGGEAPDERPNGAEGERPNAAERAAATAHANANAEAQAEAAEDLDRAREEAAREGAARELSGEQWVARFPTSRSTADLAGDFGGNVDRFIEALRAAGASVRISATLRPPERAFLMHYAWRIAQGDINPADVPAREGVEIDWVHRNAQGRPDRAASRAAAQRMVDAYEIVHRPSLTSRHTEGLAIDMTITWSGTLSIANAEGETVRIASTPRTGAGNTELHAVGATYGVQKLASDPPHWSSDGR
ncbi:MAG TPA: glycoside hydrolase family protein [Roseiflexaceae bacterium]|nr:glycoside hydrolase family protein [Roseiflexaceae bacterium]